MPDWVIGDEPYLKTLCEQAHKPDAFEDSLTKAEASKRIDTLKDKLDLE